MQRFFLAIIALFAVLFTAFYFLTVEPLGFQEGGSSGNAKIVVAGIAMIIGIVFGAMHRAWSLRVRPINFSAVRTVLRSPELWRAMLLSPIVFSGVYVAAQEQPDFILAFVVAFQSGFFCESVLRGREEAGG